MWSAAKWMVFISLLAFLIIVALVAALCATSLDTWAQKLEADAEIIRETNSLVN